jgi:hypothetical protein
VAVFFITKQGASDAANKPVKNLTHTRKREQFYQQNRETMRAWLECSTNLRKNVLQ